MNNLEMATTADADWVNRRWVMAFYYACGLNDGGNYRHHAQAFADAYQARAAAFRKGQTTFMPSVQDAWHNLEPQKG